MDELTAGLSGVSQNGGSPSDWHGADAPTSSQQHNPMAKRPKAKSHSNQEQFLAAYAACGNLTDAARSIGCDRRSHYDWLKSDPTYQQRYQEAHSEACDRLRSEARRRAVEGSEEPVYYQGVECGRIRKYSDTLLIFLMKGAMPQEFVHFAGSIDMTYAESRKPKINFDRLSLEQLEQLRVIAEVAAASGAVEGG